jgi:hypothetical protein
MPMIMVGAPLIELLRQVASVVTGTFHSDYIVHWLQV